MDSVPDREGAPARSRDAFLQRVLIVAAVVACALLLWSWRHVILLVFASSLIAIGLRGIADPIARRTPLNQGLALAVAGLALIAALGGIAWLFGAQIEAQMEGLSRRLPEAWARLRQTLSDSDIGSALVAEIESWTSTDGDSPLGGVLARVGGYTMSMASALTNALLVIVAAVFLAASPRAYMQGVLTLLPRTARDDVEGAMHASARALKKWLLGSLISMFLVALMVGVALAMLGVPAFLALALIAGIAQFVPVVGPLLAAIPGVLLAFTVSPQTAAWTAAAYFVASQIEASLIFPLIQARAVSLPPALTLFAIIAMGLLFGPLGVLLATPIVVVAMTFVVILYVRGVLKEDVRAPAE